MIKKGICMGLDVGIASNGWAILDTEENSIIGAGVRLFDAPETDKERKPTNQIRQEKRSQRRVIRRKAKRMEKIRQLCVAHDLARSHSKDLFKRVLEELNKNEQKSGKADQNLKEVTPWSLRSDALVRSLKGSELAVVLGHITKHAGFQSNRKGGEKNVAGEDKKALKAMEGLAEKIGRYRTFGEALQCDAELSSRKRNRSEIYDRTPKRAWLRQEVSVIFDRQRKFGNKLATKELQHCFEVIAFSRLPLQDSENLVRFCPFEQGEKCASKFAPSFERFRLLQKLVHLRVDDPDRNGDRLTREELKVIEAEFGKTQSLTFKKIRTLLGLSERGGFLGLPIKEDRRQKAEDRDIAARNTPGAKGTNTFRKILGDLCDTIPIEQLDDAMVKIAFRQTNESVHEGLKEIGLPNQVIEKLMRAVEDNEFHFATGAAHISAKACRKIIPGLRAGYVYSRACEEAGYDHTAPDMSPFVRLRRELGGASLTEKRKKIIAVLSDKNISPINSPVARKAAIETVKQFVTLCHEHPDLAGNLPAQVNIELTREMGRSAEERSRLTAGLERRNREIDKVATQFVDTFEQKPKKGELRVFELAQEQGWKCLYTGDHIDPHKLFDGASYQIDHILPWSRFYDNSYVNLTLCTARANQNKGNRTPYEWMSEEALDWESFAARIGARPGPKEPNGMKGIKKRNFLLKIATEKEEGFRNRNLNDTKWAAKVILQAIEALYPIELNENGNGIRRVRARPGTLTSLMRRLWGLERWKKDAKGKRVNDDRHHALDAIVVAAVSESILQRMTVAAQQARQLGKPRPFERIDPPWPGFREQVQNTLRRITCSRAERRRARGQGHEETVRSYSPTFGRIYVRKTPKQLVEDLRKKAGKNATSSELKELLEQMIERPERSQSIINSIVDWAVAGARTDNPPLGSTGDPIRKVRVIDKGKKPGVMLGEKATADRGEMVRVDVFVKKNKRGREQYYLIPIYVHQVINKRDYPEPPNLAITAHKSEVEWEKITHDYIFKFSLYPKCWISVVTNKGEVIEGYYRGASRSTNSISISPHNTLSQQRTSIGARTLLSFKKFAVDRLGYLSEIKSEPRLWHGAVCTSVNQQD